MKSTHGTKYLKKLARQHLASTLNYFCAQARIQRAAGRVRGGVHGARSPRPPADSDHGVLQWRFDDGGPDRQDIRARLADDDAAPAGARSRRAAPAQAAGAVATLPARLSSPGTRP